MSMRARLLLAFVLAGSMAAVSPTFAKIPPCPGGRFLVNGDPLMDGPAVDVIQIDGKMLSTASGCGPVKAKMRGTKVGTRVSVKFKHCTGLVAKSIVKGLITDGCATLNGTFAVPALLVLKPFLATLSMCGDGVWDPEGGEECDGDLGPCGGLCNACTCGGVTTTTSVATTTSAPGSTDTTTTTTGGTTSTGGTTTTTSGGTTSTGGTTTTSGGTTTTSGGTTTTSGASTTSSSTAAPTTTTHSTTTTTHTTTSTTSGGGPTTTSTSTSSMPVFPTTTATTSTTISGPELVPIGFSVPGIAPARAGIAADFSVKNFGTSVATAPWWEYVLWSTDQNFGGDTAIFGYQRVSNLNAGSQYSTTQTVQLPNIAAGTYYLYFQTDGANAVAEGNENNNWIGPVGIQIVNADLIPMTLTPPASANAGATIQIGYSIKNQGAGSAIGPWNDTLYLSTDMAFGGDMVLGTFAESVAGVNGTYTRNQTVIIPNVTPGTYYVFLEAETGDQIYESNENNNKKGPVAITIN
jgi:hypothetical protein